MSNSKVDVTEGSGKSIATFSFTEDAATKEVQRVVPSGSDGAEKGTSTNPLLTQFGAGVSLDAFFRLRVSDPITIFDSQNQYNKNSLLFEEVIGGAGAITHLPNESSIQLATGGTASGDKAYRVSREYFRYQPGKSQYVLMSATMGALKSNVRQRIGYFDTNNGLFFEQDGTNLKVVRRTYTSGSIVDNTVNQSNWNVDICDGSGTSGFDLDTSKAQIYFIDFEWLGVGRVRMGFVDETGKPVVCHEFRNANSLTVPYITTGNLPLQWQIENTGTAASTTTMKVICAVVISEGGFEEERALAFSASRGTSGVGVTARRAIISIRPSTTFNSIVNRAVIKTLAMELTTQTNDCLYELVYNPTFTGTPTWTAVDATNSAVEYSVHGDAAAGAISGGMVVSSGYSISGAAANRLSLSVDVLSRLPLTLNSAGASPIALSLVCTSLSGSSTNHGAFTWKELK